MDSGPNTRNLRRQTFRRKTNKSKTKGLQNNLGKKLNSNILPTIYGTNSTEDEFQLEEFSSSDKMIEEEESPRARRTATLNKDSNWFSNSSSEDNSPKPGSLSSVISKSKPVDPKDYKIFYSGQIDSKHFRDRIISKCFELCNISETKVPPNGEQSPAFDESMTPEELYATALKNQEGSKAVQAFLERSCFQSIEKYLSVFSENLPTMVFDRFGCFIVPVLIKKCTLYSQLCESFSLKSLEKAITDKCAVKVLQALAEESASFCDSFVLFFQQNYSDLIRCSDSVLVLNKAIPKVTDEKTVYFLLDDIEFDLTHKKMRHPELIRLLPNLLEKLSGNAVARLIEAIKPKIRWLIDDKIGNFCVHTLFKPKFDQYKQDLFEVLNEDPISLFDKKFRRFVLAKLISMDGNEGIFEYLVANLCSVCSYMGLIFESELSTYLLMAVISRTENLNLIQKIRNKMREFLERLCHFNNYPYYALFVQEFDAYLYICWSESNRRQVEHLKNNSLS